MKVINVLMVTVTFGKGSGVNSFIMNYFRNLDHKKVHVDILTYKKSPSGLSPYNKEIEKYGGKVFLLPDIKNFPGHIRAVNYILKKGKYDVIHDNSLLITLPLMAAAKQKRIPVRILHSHNTQLSSDKKKSSIETIVLPILKSQCTDFCACGQEAGRALFGDKVFTVIPNVIPPETNSFDQAKREAVRNKMKVFDRIVIGTVGRTTPQKNPYFAIKVIEQLSKKVPKLIYWWIGSGEMDQELKNHVKEKNLEDTIYFLGSRNDVSDLYQAMDVFFLPSLFEGLPLTGVEAQAFGLPCVVSDTVANEMVYTDLVHFVSLQDSVDDWVKALEEQIKQIPERRSYTEELKNSVYSAEGAGERLTNIYINMLNNKE